VQVCASGLLIRGFGGSSPWRRTWDDLGLYQLWVFFLRPVCPDFLTVLTRCLLESRLSDFGRLQEALTVADEAVQVLRRLAKANPAAFELDFTRALNNFGIHCRKRRGRKRHWPRPQKPCRSGGG
jgi:hypothetical protein